jgi:hypothetical protein
MLPEEAAGGAGPGAAHGLEAVEEEEVLGGQKLRLRLHGAEDVVEELGVEALHVCVRVWGALVPEVLFCILYYERTQK